MRGRPRVWITKVMGVKFRDDPGNQPCVVMSSSWIYLILAALFEIGWALSLPATRGFTRFWPSVGTLIALFLSVGLLAAAARHLPLGTAYAVWTGLGAAGAVIGGMLLLGDPVTPARLVWVGVILIGVIGLKTA